MGIPLESPAGGGTRTRTPLSRKGILSPLRLPFRHAGNEEGFCHLRGIRQDCRKKGYFGQSDVM
jgi:hypothetical protein